VRLTTRPDEHTTIAIQRTDAADARASVTVPPTRTDVIQCSRLGIPSPTRLLDFRQPTPAKRPISTSKNCLGRFFFKVKRAFRADVPGILLAPIHHEEKEDHSPIEKRQGQSPIGHLRGSLLRRITMIKRTLLLIALAAIISTALPGKAVAGRGATGRITTLTATSLSVLDKEIVTFTLDSRTHYSKWITQKPWGEDTRLDARSLRAGRLVAVHPRKDDGRVADWVQIATDMPVKD